MLLAEHTVLQPPQVLGLVRIAASQPSASLLLLQSAKPTLQAPLQTELAHVVNAMLLFEQMLLQPPQLAALLDVAVSQPSLCLLPLQSAKPASQVPALQELATHEREMLFVEHTVLQLPHDATLVDVFTSQPLAMLLSQSP